MEMHGMEDDRWTNKDRVVQWKGIVNIIVRNAEVEKNCNANEKSFADEASRIQMKIESGRNKLNAVEEHESIKAVLNFSEVLKPELLNLPIHEIIERIKQRIFENRKKLDLLRCQSKLKKLTLKDLHIEVNKLEDNNIKNKCSEATVNKMIVIRKLQDITLKIEAALGVKNSYVTIKEIMRKDALYYNGILNKLQKDSKEQETCLFKTMSIGQNAINRLNFTKKECLMFEQQIKANQKERAVRLESMRENATNISQQILGMKRNESNSSNKSANEVASKQYSQLETDMKNVTETLKKLQNRTLTNRFEEILPCIKNQNNQKERLETIKIKLNQEKNLKNKQTRCAREILKNMKSCCCRMTETYAEKKKLLEDDIQVLNNNVKSLRCRQKVLDDAQLLIRTHILYALELLSVLSSSEQSDEEKQNLIQNICAKSKLLESLSMEEVDLDAAYIKYISTQNGPAVFEGSDSGIEWGSMEDCSIPNRNSIKMESKEIVDYNQQCCMNE